MESLRALHIDRPDSLVAGLTDEAVDGALRWYRDKLTRKEKVGVGLLIGQLRKGGLAGYGKDARDAFARTMDGRMMWLKLNGFDLGVGSNADFAEAAIISLLNEAGNIDADSVARLALHMEQDQDEYDEQTAKNGKRLTDEAKGRHDAKYASTRAVGEAHRLNPKKALGLPRSAG